MSTNTEFELPAGFDEQIRVIRLWRDKIP